MTTTDSTSAPTSARTAIIASVASHHLHLVTVWGIVVQAIGADNEVARRQQALIDATTLQLRNLRDLEERAALAERQQVAANVARLEALDATC